MRALTPKKRRLVFLFYNALSQALSDAETRELNHLMQANPRIEVWRIVAAPQALQ